MNRHALLRACTCALALAFASALPAQIVTAPGVTVRSFTNLGFLNPRGLSLAPAPPSGTIDLYVAEGGPGGTSSTAGRCAQVAAPIGPYTGSLTGGRISRFYYDFERGRPFRYTVTTNLPTSQTAAASGALVSGAAAVAFIGGDLYALVGGGGCSHGVQGRPNAIVRVSRSGNGTVSLVANLSQWLRSNPGQVVAPDFEPDGTWYSMVAYNGALYVVEPNQGQFIRVNPTTGAITRILDVSAALGTHAVPTALARHKGYFYIANLGPFPIVNGTQRVWRVLSNPSRLQAVAQGTAIVGLAFDPVTDAMYILQLTSGASQPTPGRGSIVRVRPGGARQTIVSGLTFPTSMTISPEGALFVSHKGFGGGTGEILEIFGLR